MFKPFLSVLAVAWAVLAGAGCSQRPGAPTEPAPQPLAIHAGDILVTDSDDASGRVIAIDSSGVQTVVASGAGLKYPAGIALAANGDLLVAVQFGADGTGGIFRISRSTGAQTAVSAGDVVLNPTGIAVDTDGNIYAPCSVSDTAFGGDGSGTAGTVVKIDAGGNVTVLTDAPLAVTYGIALEDGGTLVVNSGFLPAIVARVDPTSHAQTTVSSGGSLQPLLLGVALDAGGNILVAGDASGVIRVDPSSGAQTTVSSGGSFQVPFGITLEDSGNILVADSGGGLIRVNPATGAQTTLAWGAPMTAPTAVVVVP